MLKLEPYLQFNGNCEEAFNFYKTVFGGEFKDVTRYKDIPDQEKKMAAENLEKIVHIGLPVGKTVVLMGADTTPEMRVNVGNNINLALSTRKERVVKELFNALAEGGTVIMPLQKTFWAELYGALTDKFGINWVISRAKDEDA